MRNEKARQKPSFLLDDGYLAFSCLYFRLSPSSCKFLLAILAKNLSAPQPL